MPETRTIVVTIFRNVHCVFSKLQSVTMIRNDRLTYKKRQQGALLKYLVDLLLNKRFISKLKFNLLRVCQRKYDLFTAWERNFIG